jgi:putative copper resistance protein D
VLHSAPTGATVAAAWTVSPVVIGLLVLASAGYLWMVRLAGRSGSRWPVRRTASWFAAMLTVVISVDGPVGVFAEALFWVHMVQHLLLIMIAPMLLVWAQPIRLLGVAGGAGVSARMDTAWANRMVRLIGSPLLGLAVYSGVVVLTHLTGFQQVSATEPAVRAMELLLYLVAGWMFFVTVAGAERVPWNLPYLLRFVVLAVGMGADTLTGVVLMLSSHPLAPVYGLAHPGWGPEPLRDQELAGAIMWFGGDLLMMLLMILVAVEWGRAGADRQGLGDWLEGARRRAVLGDDDSASEQSDDGGDLDSDQRALDAYNATLAAMYGKDRGEKHDR